MQNLVDGDFASNNGGWQWSSSTGTDAAPYFRIFNTLTQSKNFDSDGLFIKKHIKELENIDKKEIHDPSSDIRESQNYPEQILDLKQSRLRAIDAFNAAKNSRQTISSIHLTIPFSPASNSKLLIFKASKIHLFGEIMPDAK